MSTITLDFMLYYNEMMSEYEAGRIRGAKEMTRKLVEFMEGDRSPQSVKKIFGGQSENELSVYDQIMVKTIKNLSCDFDKEWIKGKSAAMEKIVEFLNSDYTSEAIYEIFDVESMDELSYSERFIISRLLATSCASSSTSQPIVHVCEALDS